MAARSSDEPGAAHLPRRGGDQARIKLSGSFIAFGSGPLAEAGWLSAEAYWRVYQDWRAWTEEGIIDVAMPMIYQRDHVTSGRTAFDRWNDWVRNHQYARSAAMGIGSFLNSVEGTLTQVRRALAPSALGNRNIGVTFFSMATSNVAVTANPLSTPHRARTRRRGRLPNSRRAWSPAATSDGATLLEDPAANPVPVFDQPAAIPDLSWKTNPQVGHLRGVVRDESGAVVDTGDVTVSRVVTGPPPGAGRSSAAGATDGNGYYGAIDLAPGVFNVTVTPVGQAAFPSQCSVQISAGAVTTFDITIDRTAPSGKLTANPSVIWPPNGKMVTVTLSGALTDAGTGLGGATFRVLDEYGAVQPSIDPVDGDGQSLVEFSRTVELEASRRGNDRDGRTYTIEAIVTDGACNATTLRTTVVVPHDRRPSNP